MAKKKKQKRVLSPEALEVLRRTAAYARQVRQEKRQEREALGLTQPYTKPVKAEPKARPPAPDVAQVTHYAAVDMVNHPSHYKVGGIETIDFIEAKGLSYNLGNVVKYVTRAGHKGDRKQDLEKARWYLDREISTLS